MTMRFKEYLIESTVNFDTTDISETAKLEGRKKLLSAGGYTKDLPAMAKYFKDATPSNLMAAYNDFVQAFPSQAKAINAAKPDGVGPGEMVLYFVFNNVGIGGKNANIDMFLNGKPFAEVKAGRKLGSDAINNFKVTKDGDKAVSQLLKDLTDFNDLYVEITGEDLDGWQGSGKVNTSKLRDWKEIDLKKLAAEGSGGGKKAVDLVLKKDGDLLRKGDSDVVMNVLKQKSVAPVKDLITGETKVVVDDKISTIDKIVTRWVDQAFEDYIGGKKFAFIESENLKMRHFGAMTKDMLDLDYTNRNQPYAKVYLAPAGKSKEKESKPK